jgi:hypothetical protein
LLLALFILSSLRDFNLFLATQGLRPGLSSVAPPGLVLRHYLYFSRGLIRLRPHLHPGARSTRPGTVLSRSILRRQSSFRIARTLAETLLEKFQSSDANSKSLLLDTVATPEIRTRLLYPGSRLPETATGSKFQLLQKPLQNPTACHPRPRICGRRRTAALPVTSARRCLELSQ